MRGTDQRTGDGAPTAVRERRADRARRQRADAAGYDAGFLGSDLAVPEADAGARRLDYTHFSLAMNTGRRLAWWVAWNIDGTRLFPDVPRESGFHLDDRLAEDEQTGEEVYADNDLDRGHLARRSDLLWGDYEEAKQANYDSFAFPNISPQLNTFNQSGLGGVWGELENGVLALEGLTDRRISVFAGPVLADDDPPYRGLVQVPRDHWKVVVYHLGDDEQPRFRAFLLTQDLDGLEPRTFLEDFVTFQVDLADLERRTGLTFGSLSGLEADGSGGSDAAARPQTPTRIDTLDAIDW